MDKWDRCNIYASYIDKEERCREKELAYLERQKKYKLSKENNRISWNEFFMGVAELAAKRSRDFNTKVGACIVKDKKILSTGYNGMPRTCDNCNLPVCREADNWLDTKYPYVVHAEINAILNTASLADLKGATLYVTLLPCNECAKAILQSGINTIYYLDDKHPDDDIYIAAKKMFNLSNIKLIKFEKE